MTTQETNPEATGKVKSIYFKTFLRIAAIFVAGFTLYLIMSTIILFFLTKPKKEVRVPDVKGKEFFSVYNSLVRKGLKPVVKFKDIMDIDDGLILSQYPEKNRVVPENSSITLVVNRSTVLLEVPKLVGIPFPMAQNKLKNIHYHDRTLSLGLGVVSYIPSNTIEESMVIDQQPPAGEKITLDRRINMLVSSGKIGTDPVMPDLTGQSIELCFDLLAAKGLRVLIDPVKVEESSLSGLIAGQSIEPKAAVNRGDEVVLKVQYYTAPVRAYSAYEKVEYKIPSEFQEGLYEALVDDAKSKRIRFSRQMKPGQMMLFIFFREGDAKVNILCNKKHMRTMNIDAD